MHNRACHSQTLVVHLVHNVAFNAAENRVACHSQTLVVHLAHNVAFNASENRVAKQTFRIFIYTCVHDILILGTSAM